jgi:tetratricopeptide (TPR) repeat protein
MATLDPERWAAVSPYLDQVLELPEGERASWVAHLRHRLPAIAADLELLLEDHAAVSDERFLEDNLHPPLTAPALIGQKLGPYTLKSAIGHGGMGSVWLAERSDGRFERLAAVKLLNLALAAHGETRFRTEGRILARLTHPQIAQLLDAGVSPSGQPFLVLEHVDGQPIDEFCNTRGLDIQARIVLFLDVLAAVAHAHANLVVHRDLKPSNVLVTKDGQVKLLDFGIAKLLVDEAGGTPRTGITREFGAALTPEYAAPEQIMGEAVSTATDVYALGILLFLLLTKQHPAGEHRRSPADLMKAIVEVDFPRPSDVASDARVRRLLQGDLDTILGKALKKKPSERYASVTELANDLRRYMRHEPITARPDTFGYRAAKFVRRHRWPVATAIVTIAVLSAALFVANRQRLAAERRFQQLRQLSDQVFGLDREIRHLPGATQAREALVSASLQYLEGLAKDASRDLELLQEVSEGYWRVGRIQGVPSELNLGNLSKAEETLAKAAASSESILAARPGDPRAMFLSAAIAQDRMIVAETGRRTEDALNHARLAVERRDAFLASGQATDFQRGEAATLYGNVSLAYINLKRYDEAIQMAQRQVDIANTLKGPEQKLAFALSLLANARRLKGDLDGALEAIQEARQYTKRVTYPDDTARMLDLYGIVLREGFILGEDRAISLNRPDDAAAAFREAFTLTDEAAKRDPNDSTSRSRVGTSGRELGDVLRWRQPEEALQVYDVGLSRLREVRNNVRAQRDTALILANSSYALRLLKRPEESERRLSAALQILTETKDYPAERIALDSPVYAVLLAGADHHADTGDQARALREYETLVERVLASKPDVENDLREAYGLSLLYEGLARRQRAMAATSQADQSDEKRQALWNHWNGKLPQNPFVLRQLQAQPASTQ